MLHRATKPFLKIGVVFYFLSFKTINVYSNSCDLCDLKDFNNSCDFKDHMNLRKRTTTNYAFNNVNNSLECLLNIIHTF